MYGPSERDSLVDFEQSMIDALEGDINDTRGEDGSTDTDEDEDEG